MTKEVAADTLTWLLKVKKQFVMTVLQFHTQPMKFNQSIPYMPRDEINNVDNNKLLGDCTIKLVIHAVEPNKWRDNAAETGQEYLDAASNARYYEKLKKIDDKGTKKKESGGGGGQSNNDNSNNGNNCRGSNNQNYN
mmetsp:Transcript_46881/g.56366  ORF Transcript_46881/g.56366 Transcript_46881/m.56366 type:complete len:137 (+) Transcript_46881:489-899(+)